MQTINITEEVLDIHEEQQIEQIIQEVNNLSEEEHKQLEEEVQKLLALI